MRQLDVRFALAYLHVSKVNKNIRKLLLCKNVEHRICIVYIYFTGTAMQQIEQNAFGSFI